MNQHTKEEWDAVFPERKSADPNRKPLPDHLQKALDSMRDTDNQDVNKGAAKFDGQKVRVDLVPAEFTYATAATLTYGAIKYDEWNWAKGLRKGRLIAALMRHAMRYLVREEVDPESGLPHTWHMAACIAMLIASEARGTAIEDREEAVGAMDRMEAQFTNMKDPRGTQLNGGGTLS